MFSSVVADGVLSSAAALRSWFPFLVNFVRQVRDTSVMVVDIRLLDSHNTYQHSVCKL